MLNNKERQRLFASSNSIEHKHTIGKGAITAEVITTLDKALTANELIKIHVGKSGAPAIDEMAETLCSKLDADLIKVIGRTIVLYRQNDKKKGDR